MDAEPKVVYTARSNEDAHLLKNILAENGINAQVVNADLTSGVFGGGAWLGGAFQVVVAAGDTVEARRIAVEFDQHQAVDTAENVEPATSAAAPGDWPVCPRCGTRRTAVCPACRTEGTDFPAADKMPEAEPGETSRQLLICPECDEPFMPGYLHRCAQCDYPFEGPGDVDDVEDLETGALRTHFSSWVWVVALISVVLVVAAIAILFLSSEPRKPAWTPPGYPHAVERR